MHNTLVFDLYTLFVNCLLLYYVGALDWSVCVRIASSFRMIKQQYGRCILYISLFIIIHNFVCLLNTLKSIISETK